MPRPQYESASNTDSAKREQEYRADQEKKKEEAKKNKCKEEIELENSLAF